MKNRGPEKLSLAQRHMTRAKLHQVLGTGESKFLAVQWHHLDPHQSECARPSLGDGKQTDREKEGQVGEAVDPVTGFMSPACWALTSSRDVTRRVRTIETQDLRGWTRDLRPIQSQKSLTEIPPQMLYSVVSDLGICQYCGRSWSIPTDLRPKKKKKVRSRPPYEGRVWGLLWGRRECGGGMEVEGLSFLSSQSSI